MNFLPHGYCFAWTPRLLWSMVGADSFIAAAYFSIPLAIVSVVRRRGESHLGWLPWLFSGCIFSCGLTHIMDVWTIWQPYYGLQSLMKAVTAGLSVVTAVVLWRLVPTALSIPSIRQLQAVIESLEAEARKRRDAEYNLAGSQQSLAVTLASIGAGFMTTDSRGRVVDMNAVAEKLTGWSVSEARGHIYWEVFMREDRPQSFRESNPVDVMLAQGVTIDDTYHVELKSRDGRRTAVELKADVTRTADGGVRGSVFVFRDMSRLMKAKEEASRLAAIVESTNDAIIAKDLDGNITTWNEAARNLFGYTAEEVVGRSVLMLVPPERRHEEIDHLTALAQGLRVPTGDTVGLAKDGSALQLSVTVSPIRDTRGLLVGSSRIARDVSVQRRAEAALRDSEARLRFTMEAARIGEWDLDLKTGVARQSVLHASCFGYHDEVPEWSFDTFMQHVHPEDRAELAASFDVRAHQPDSWQFECRVVWPDQSLHWVRVHGSSLYENGTPTRMLGIVMDITKQKAAEESRLKALRLEAENREIQEASRLKSLFLANMSHELRTPLNAIIGFSDLLHSGIVKADSPKYHEFLGHIGASGRHLLQLIKDILDLSKVESGRFEFFPEPVELPGLIMEICGVLETAVQRKSIRMAQFVDASLSGTIEVDPSRLKQVLYNYISNAIKFSHDGGHVTVRATAEGPRHFRIEVEDDGIGIAEEDQSRLFNEFLQLDSGMAKQHQGTGLGLALTRRLVEAQGGSVGLRSELGAGSTFYLVLNRHHGTDEPRGAAALPPAA